jgi:VWFA-related protein
VVSAHFRVRAPALVVVVLLSGLLKLAVSGQNPLTIRTSSSLVLVPVSPVDETGHFVSGLSIKDFEILVDGKRVKIAHFDVTTESSPETVPSSPKSVALPPNLFRNISETSASQPNLVVLLVDYLNTRMVERMALRDELLKFFSTKLKPDQEIAIYGLTQSLVLLQPFTRDTSALIAAAKQLLQQKGQPADPKIGSSLVKPGMDPLRILVMDRNKGTDRIMEYLSARNARVEYNVDQLNRAARTLAAFRELAESFGGMPGKKSVIWLTGDASPLNPTLLYRNLPFDRSIETPETSWWQTAKTYEALNAAGVTVFPVDIRGVANTGLLPAEGFRTHEEFRESLGGTQPDDMSPYSGPTGFRQGEAANAVLAMNSVASETGGTVLAGSNDIGELLSRAHKLWANYYVLAFVPEKTANESLPAYHKIKVNVSRKGVHVLARRGYTVRPENLVSSEPEIERDLIEAAASPIDFTSVELQLSLGESKDIDHIAHFPFALTVSGGVLGATSDKGAPYDLSIAVLVLDQDGKRRTAAGKRVRDLIPQAEISKGAAKGLKYDSEFQAPIGAAHFGRVIVRDNLSGRIGTISFALPNTPAGPRG